MKLATRSTQRRQRDARRQLWLLLRLLATAGVIVWISTQLNPDELRRLLSGIALFPLVLAILLQLAGIWLSAWKWWYILRSDGSRVSYMWLVRLYFVGQFVSLVLPTIIGGDAVRGWMLTRRGIRPTTAAVSILAERLTGFVALTGIAAVALVTNAHVLAESPRVLAGATYLVLCAAALVAVALAAPIWSTQIARLPLPDIAGWRGILADVVSALTALFARPRDMAVVMATSLVFQLSSIGVTYATARALGLPISWGYSALIVPLADIVGLLPVLVGDWGGRLITYTTLLVPLAIAPSAAAGLAVLVSLIRAGVGSLGAAVALWGNNAEQGQLRAALDSSSSYENRRESAP